jgi:hypothetical protein
MPPFLLIRRLAPLAVLLASGAHADVTLVQKTSVEGLPESMRAQRASMDRPSTLYYKGDKLRTETGTDAVTILDGERLYLIDTKKKTYAATTAERMMAESNPMLSMVDVQTEVSVKPGGKTKTIAGKPAQNWRFTLTMKLAINATGMAQAAPGQPPPGQLPTIRIEGEQWSTTAAAVPPTARSLRALSMLQSLVGPKGQAALRREFEKIKGLPLELTLTQTVQGVPTPANGKPIVTRMTTVSLSEKPLPESLFALPKGYKQVPFEGPKMPTGRPTAQ